jgi:asparagine synthase (glutamine-hydrolysing)
MPGIFGVVSADSTAPCATALGTRMRDILRHDESYKDYLFETQGCLLGGSTPAYFNAIVKPTFSRDRNLCLVLEGEIFNGDELRAELKLAGHGASTGNDAELMMQLYEVYGTGLVHKVNGLFIGAFWNKRECSLTFLNDRVGVHYLYYHNDMSTLLFGPEMKALLCDPRLQKKLDPEAVADFFTFGFVSGTRTFVREIKVMPPGTVMRYERGRLTLQNYWDFPFTEPHSGQSKNDYIEELHHVLKRATKRQTSDHCRYGIALSGGIDSRLLAGYLGHAVSPLHTFTFGDSDTDEAKIAEKISCLVGGKHRRITYSVEEFAESFEKIIWLTEGPINTAEYYQLAKSVNNSVDVAFCGHGGDVLSGRNLTRAVYRAEEIGTLQKEIFSRYSRRVLGSKDPSELFSSDYHARIDGSVWRNLDSTFADLQTEVPANAELKHTMKTRVWREVTRIVDLPRLCVRYRYPYFDYEVLDFFLRLPPSMRLDAKVYRGLLICHFPKLANIPYPNRRCSVRTEEYLRPYYAARNLFGHFIVSKFYRTLCRFAPPECNISHNIEAYRGPLRDQVLRLVLDGNRKRGYFNQQALETLLSEHVNREANNSFLMHKLITFELFHKLYIDPSKIERPALALL